MNWIVPYSPVSLLLTMKSPVVPQPYSFIPVNGCLRSSNESSKFTQAKVDASLLELLVPNERVEAIHVRQGSSFVMSYVRFSFLIWRSFPISSILSLSLAPWTLTLSQPQLTRQEVVNGYEKTSLLKILEFILHSYRSFMNNSNEWANRNGRVSFMNNSNVRVLDCDSDVTHIAICCYLGLGGVSL